MDGNPPRAASPSSSADLMTTSATPHPDQSPRSVAGTPRSSATGSHNKRLRRQCTADGCVKVDAGGGFCVAHGGGKKCAFPGCRKGYQTGGFCRQHGGGARCQVQGCGKVDAGRGLCRGHGGGKRCQQDGCSKADVGGGLCTAHGGGKRCSQPGCTKIDQGGGKCRAHGGARRCRQDGCTHPARGASGLCSDHGGAQLCVTPNCRRIAKEQGGTYCPACAKDRVKKKQGDDADMEEEEQEDVDDDKAMPPFAVMLARNSNSPPQDFMAMHMEPMEPFHAFIHAAASVDGQPTPSYAPPVFAHNNSDDDDTIAAPLEESAASRNEGSCLDNGCSKSFGGRCNCKVGCTCCSRARAAERVGRQEETTTGSQSTSPSTTPSPPAVTYLALLRLVVQIRVTSLPHEAIKSLLTSISGVRSVSGQECLDQDSSEADGTSHSLVLRCDPEFDVSSFELLSHLNLAVHVHESSTVHWSYKEIVLEVPDMMCPGNCGRTVMNALLPIASIHVAHLAFEERCVITRGDMGADELCAAVQAVGFEPAVVATLPLPKCFKFRVSDFASVYLFGARLRSLLRDVEGVESVLLVENRAEVIVETTLEDAGALLQAANANRIMMVEIPEEAIAPLASPFDPTSIGRPCHEINSNSSGDRTSQFEGTTHVCDLNECPSNGCEQYMLTVAHTAALAVGWSVPGCAMGWGGECTCGENCKCKGCPQHNPSS